MYQYYLVNVTILANGYEKNNLHLIYAPSDEDACLFACFMESHDTDNITWNIENVSDCGFEYIVDEKSVKLITDEAEIETLKKYISYDEYSRKKLSYAGNYDEYFDEYPFEEKCYI